MKNGSKIFGTILLVLGFACFGLYYFFQGDSNKEYTVYFDSNGGSVVAEKVVKSGEKLEKPADPTKENSEFMEWELDGVAYNFDNPVSKSMTLVAKWSEVLKRNIKVVLDGVEYTADINDGETITPTALNIPEKEGFLVKFYNENNEEVDINNPVTQDMILTANYVEIKTYTIKFNSNGGSSVEAIKVVEGSTATEPTSTKDGYILDGWYLGNEKFDFSTPINKDITLKAKWKDGNKVNVIFTVDGKNYKTIAVAENTKVSKPTNPTKKGYKFVEWQLEGNAYNFDTPVTAEITLTALFEEAKMVTVTFDSDGGDSVASQEIELNAKVSKPTDPTKSGYKFAGWQLGGKKYDFNKEVTESITLKAIWEKVYTVKFNDYDGKEISSQTVVEGEKATRPSNPTREGYTFSEWLYNHAAYDFSKAVTDNITLTASYSKNDSSLPDEIENSKNYIVSFDSDGGTNVESQTIKNGEKATKPTNPTKDNYTFLEWQLNGNTYNFDTIITKNIILKAIWKAKSYTFKLSDINETTFGRTITVYEDGNKINFSSIRVNGKELCTGSNPVVGINDIEGITSVTVILTNGNIVTATLA